MIEKILQFVPTFVGRGAGEKLVPIHEWFAFQRDVESLVESADYKSPSADFGDMNLVYDPIADEFHLVHPEEPEASLLGPALGGFFGLLVATSLFRTVLTVQWRKSWRMLVTMHLGSAPKPIHNFRRLRAAFNSTPAHSPSPLKNHSHGASAAARLGALQLMDAVCTATGLTRYSFQMSSSEQSLNVPGERMFYWAKDTSAEPQFDAADDTHIVSLVDVDYYVDMPTHLADSARPHLLYTVQPETAGRLNGEYSYSFNAAGECVWRVSGGASYTHRIWNYGVDCFLATRTFCGIPYKAVMYDVQSRHTSDDKQVILLAPMRLFYGLTAVLAWFMAPPLRRLDPVVGKFAKVVVYGSAGKVVSVAPQCTETSCTIPGKVFDALLSQRNISPKGQLNAYQTKSLLTHVPADQLDQHKDLIAGILTEYMNTAGDRIVDPLQVVDRVVMTQVAFEAPDATDKPCLVAFAKPFGVPPAFVPVNNKASSDQSIIGRVLLPRQQVETILGEFKMTPFKQQCLNEFVRRLVPEPHVGVPYDYLAVAEKQVKPGQKLDLSLAGLLGAVSGIVKTFMKREAYGKPTDPRNITTFNPKAKIDYAHFMYPLMDHLKRFRFYAFGRTPRAVAERVASIAKNSDVVACPDIHRMDGFVNAMCRDLERAVGTRYFAPEYVDEFVETHSKSYGNMGITSHGLRYEQEESRGSGEMGTSAWNTIENLFMIFYAKMLLVKDFDNAWEFLLEKAVAGGDDSVVGDMPDDVLIRAARDCGFILKCPLYRRADNEAGVNFLARVYGPDVWNGDPNSMCSLRRQMEKFHLTVAAPISAQQKLFEKALSFLHTDANTPVIGGLCRAIKAALPGLTTTHTITRWGDDVAESDQYPNDVAGWMIDVAREELPLTNFNDFVAWIDSLPSVEDLLNAPLFYEEGREFTYDEYDPEPGMLIKRTRDVLQPTKVKKARLSAQPFDVSKVTFGDVDSVDSEKKN